MTELTVRLGEPAEPALRFSDNPIAVAQFRRRMRARQAGPTLVVMALLGACAVLYALVSTEPALRLSALHLLYGLLALVLWFGGSTQTSAMVAEDRKSRLLDFHRATPTTPWTDCLGYLVGSPAREWACAVVLAPFLVVLTVLAGASLAATLGALVVAVGSGLFYHSIGLITGLSAREGKARQVTIGVLTLIGIVSLNAGSTGFAGVAHLTPFPALAGLGFLGQAAAARAGTVVCFGVTLPSPVYTLLVQGTLFAFLFVASARKLHREGAHSFSRPGAIAFLSLLVLLGVGPGWALLGDGVARSGTILFYVALALPLAGGLAVSLVPTCLEHVRTLRRAARHGRAPSWLEQGAATWPMVPALLAVFVLGVLVIAAGAAGGGAGFGELVFTREVLLLVASAAALLALLVTTVESNRLRLRRAARSGTFLVAFVVFVLPWVAGAILTASHLSVRDACYVYALSPLFAAGGSALLVAWRWGMERDPGIGIEPIVLSIVVAAALATWFAVRAADARRRLLAGHGTTPPPAQ